ncbi:MAG: DUF2934 domain-containing protein [Methylococcaceae bacterium]|nr:DUF2934 domain-containing protein [Methylococcaceae bacterium]
MTTNHLQPSVHIKGTNPEKVRKMIAECAYYKAEKRGFTPGHELDDWLEAKHEINKQCFYWNQEVW